MAQLFLDLRTNFVPVTEFSWIEVHIIRRSDLPVPPLPPLPSLQFSNQRYFDLVGAVDGDYIAGQRVAVIDDIELGDYAIFMRLLDNNGSAIALRSNGVHLTTTQASLTIISRP